MIKTFQIIELSGNHFSVYTETDGTKEDHTQRLEIENKEVIKWSCDCAYGSAYRFKHRFKANFGEYKCKHIIEVIEELKLKDIVSK